MPANVTQRLTRVEAELREHGQELRMLNTAVDRHDQRLSLLESRVRVEEHLRDHDRRLRALESRAKNKDSG
jgi:hypothetical protein